MKLRTFAKNLLPRTVNRKLSRSMAMQYLQRLDPPFDPAKKTILAINHLFDQDLRALELANARYNLVVVNAGVLFKGAQFYFSQEIMDIRAPYESEPLSNREAYRGECREYFDYLRDRFNPGLIITPNDNYYKVREFIIAARESGVRTVILDKEGTISPHSFEAEAKRARDYTPCISDHVFVWSERQKKYWQNRGVEAGHITIVGQPRSDLFFADDDSQVDGYFETAQPLVTFFSYFDTAYIPQKEVDQSGVSWRTMKKQSQEAVWRMARQYPDRNFVIKCHPQQLDIDLIRDTYQSPNLRVIGGAEVGNELIRRSDLIIAFQTTAVIEAMFLNKRIIYTAWDENYQRLSDDLLPLHRAPGIVVAKAPAQFEEICARFFSGDESDFDFSPEELAGRDRFVNEYFYKPNGHVCERFLAAVDRFMV